MAISWKYFVNLSFRVPSGKKITDNTWLLFQLSDQKLETQYGIRYFEVLLYILYYVHHHNTCNSPYLSLYLSTLWSNRNSKLKKNVYLKRML